MKSPKLDQTRYLRREVVSFLQGAPEPFFLWFTPTADHGPFEAPPGRTEHDYANVQWPDRREEDVERQAGVDPGSHRVRRRPSSRRCAMPSGCASASSSVSTTRSPVPSRRCGAKGRLDNTVVVFTSDNGVFWGEHRVPPGSKNMPYEPAVLVPCMVRGPGFPHATLPQQVHMSMDLTATCVELGAATPDLPLDGVSLTEVIADPGRFDDRQLLYDRGSTEAVHLPVPREPGRRSADGVFTRTRKLVRYRDSTRRCTSSTTCDADPGELQNVADDPAYADDRADLEAALDRMLSG